MLESLFRSVMVSVLPVNLISCRVSYFVFVVATERTSSSREISEIHVKPFLVKVRCIMGYYSIVVWVQHVRRHVIRTDTKKI